MVDNIDNEIPAKSHTLQRMNAADIKKIGNKITLIEDNQNKGD